MQITPKLGSSAYPKEEMFFHKSKKRKNDCSRPSGKTEEPVLKRTADREEPFRVEGYLHAELGDDA